MFIIVHNDSELLKMQYSGYVLWAIFGPYLDHCLDHYLEQHFGSYLGSHLTAYYDAHCFPMGPYLPYVCADPCPWAMVMGVVALGPWGVVVHGPWSWTMDQGPWTMVQGHCPMDHGTWTMVHGPWPIVHGPWPMDRDLHTHRANRGP